MKQFLLLLALPALCLAQTQINYTDGQNRSTAIDTSPPNDPTTLDLTSGTATQSGDISGSGGVIKDGKGLLVLDGANTYTGSTSVVEGTLQIGQNDAVSTGTHLDVSAGATFDLNSKTGTVGTLSGAGNLNLGLGGDLTVNTAGSGYFSGIISGTGGSITKGGTGELALRGPNTYSGGTILNQGILTAYNDGAFGTGLLTVNGGTLKVDDDRRIENNIRLNNDLNVDLVGSSSNYNLVFVGDVDLGGTTRAITVNRTGTQYVYLGGPISDSIGNGGLTLRGDGVDDVRFYMDGAESNTYTGLTLVDNMVELGLDKTGGATAIAGDLTINPGALVVLIGDEQIADTSTVNLRGGATLRFHLGPIETIDTLTDDGPDNEILYFGDGSLYVREGNIQAKIRTWGSGQNVFGQKGNGTVTLLNPDSDFGPDRLLTVDGGTLRIGVNGAASGAGMRILSDGSTLSYGDGVDLSNSLELRADGNLEVLAGESATHSGIISEDATARSLTKTGGGSLELTGANTYSGGTTVSGGTLAVGTDTNLGTGDVTLDGGTLRATAGFTMTNPALDLGPGGGTIEVDTGATLRRDQPITGTGSLTKTGGGFLTLRDNHAFSGGVILDEGTIFATHNSAFGSGDLTINGGRVKVDASRLFNNDISLNSDVTVILDAPGAQITAGFNGDIDLGGGQRTIGVRYTQNNRIHLGGAISNGGLRLVEQAGRYSNFRIDGSTSNTFTGETFVGDGMGVSLAKTGGATAIAGDLVVEGSVFVSETEQIADTSAVTLRDGGRLQVMATETIDTLTDIGNGNWIRLSGGSLYVRDGTIGAEFEVPTFVGNWPFPSPLPPPFIFGQKGDGTVVLTNSNNVFQYDVVPTITIDGGTLRIAVNGAASTAGAIGVLSNGSTLSYGDGVSLNHELQLQADGNVEVLAGESATHSGVISESGGVRQLTKTGDGSLSLTGNNTTTGGTIVSGGTLYVNNTTGSGTGTGDVTVDSGATLGGDGIIGGNLIMNGTLTPGNSPGTLTVLGDLTLAGLTVIEIDSLSLFDQVDVGGMLTYGGDVEFDFGFTPTVGDSFDVFDFASTDTDTFNSVNINNPGIEGDFDHSTGILSITAIPEPATLMLLLGGVLTLLHLRRRFRG